MDIDAGSAAIALPPGPPPRQPAAPPSAGAHLLLPMTDLALARALAPLMPPADPEPEERDVRATDLARLKLLLRPRERVTFALEGAHSWAARTFDPDDPHASSCSVVGRGTTLASAVRDLLSRL